MARRYGPHFLALVCPHCKTVLAPEYLVALWPARTGGAIACGVTGDILHAALVREVRYSFAHHLLALFDSTKLPRYAAIKVADDIEHWRVVGVVSD